MSLPLRDQFERRHKRRLPNGCIIWLGSTNAQTGYGDMRIRDGARWRTEVTHRIAWMLKFGPIPYGRQIRHSCDRRNCVNVDHLLIGTAQDNADDMVNRDRSAKGERHSQAKLKTVNVLRIDRLLRIGCSRRSIAAKYDVGVECIDKIARGDRWTHVTGRTRRFRKVGVK